MKADQSSPRGRVPQWCRLAGTVLLRMWLTFSILAFVLAIAFSVMQHDSLLASDDPYIPAGIVAGFCAGLTLAHCVVEALVSSPIKRIIAYFGSVLGLSVFFIVLDVIPMNEGQGILTFLGVLIAIAGAATYPILRIRLTRLSLAFGSLPGVLYFLGYLCAAMAMSARGV